MDTGLNPSIPQPYKEEVMTRSTINYRKIHSFPSKLSKELETSKINFKLENSPKTIKKMIAVLLIGK
jgi:hypothetical protein